MQMRFSVVVAMLWFALGGPLSLAALQEGVRLEADGRAIDVPIGHLVPCATDWNDDGKKDLVVGQFAKGQIRFYPNRGTDAAPKFKDFSYLQAGGEEIRLSAG